MWGGPLSGFPIVGWGVALPGPQFRGVQTARGNRQRIGSLSSWVLLCEAKQGHLGGHSGLVSFLTNPV